MNKLRLIKIYELRGNVHPIEAFIICLLGEVEKVYNRDFIQYIKEEWGIFSYCQTSKTIYLLHIYSYFDKRFKCSDLEKREIMKYLLEKHLKLEINNIR